jgi:hypothetical protein
VWGEAGAFYGQEYGAVFLDAAPELSDDFRFSNAGFPENSE